MTALQASERLELVRECIKATTDVLDYLAEKGDVPVEVVDLVVEIHESYIGEEEFLVKALDSIQIFEVSKL